MLFAMAEITSLSASLLDTATIGACLTTPLRNLTSAYPCISQDQSKRLNDLLTSIALTSSALTELGFTIQKHENEFLFKRETFEEAREIWKSSLEKLRAGLGQVKKGSGRENGWGALERLGAVLGGEQNLGDLIDSSERLLPLIC